VLQELHVPLCAVNEKLAHFVMRICICTTYHEFIFSPGT